MRKKIRKKIILLSSFLVAFILVPFSGSAQLNCYSLQAPEITIEGLEKIAILNFQNRSDVHWRYTSRNDYGSQLTDYMIAMLLEEHRGVYTKESNKANKATTADASFKQFKENRKANKYAKGENYMERYKTNVYTLVERDKLDQIMSEQSLGAAGAVSDGDAAKIGQLLGLDVIISGGYTSDVKQSVSRSGSSSSTGGYSAKIVVTVDVTMKIISVETGEVLSMTNKASVKKNKASGRSSSEASGKLPTGPALIRDCLKDLSAELVSHFAPTFVYQALEVEKPAGKGYKDDFNKAKDFVKDNDLSNAFLVIKKVYDKDPYDAAMAHNMGVLFEAVGNFDQSIEYHKIAYELDDSKDHKEALARALNSKEALDQLGKLGVDVSPYKFDENAAAALNIVKVTTKGKKNDRFEVYLDANKGTDVVARVPGETKFEKLGEEGSFVKIKLIGGKAGFISKSDLDD